MVWYFKNISHNTYFQTYCLVSIVLKKLNGRSITCATEDPTSSTQKDGWERQTTFQRTKSKSSAPGVGPWSLTSLFLSKRRKLKGTGKEGERVRVSGEGKQMSASLGASSSLRFAYHRLVVLMDVKLPSCFPLALPLLLPGCGRQDETGWNGTWNSGGAEGRVRSAFPPCLHPVWRRGACLSVPRGRAGRETASLLRSWGRINHHHSPRLKAIGRTRRFQKQKIREGMCAGSEGWVRRGAIFLETPASAGGPQGS